MTNRHMRIALTADPELTVPPMQYGGIERVIDMLAQTLARRGHDVTLFSHPASTCSVRRVSWSGRKRQSFRDTLRNAATLARHVAAGRFDIVHSFSRIAYLTPILPWRVPKLMSYQREISPRTTAAAVRMSRGTLEFSAISRQMIEAVRLAGEWHLIPNGVPLHVYEFKNIVPPDAPLVFLGRIEEIKGPHLAIDIARRSGRRLIIAGNVPDAHRPWFQTHILPHIDGDRVRYVGPVDDAAKNVLLGEAAAFLMPILWEEPFGIVMAEAMACGTPVLGLRRGSVPEVVEDGVTGFITDTPEELAASVAKIGILSRASSRARVEALYSEDAVTDGYLQVYDRMIHRLRRTRGETVAMAIGSR